MLARTCRDSRGELPGVSARAATASSELFPTDRIRECTDLSLGRFADRRRVQTFVSAVAAAEVRRDVPNFGTKFGTTVSVTCEIA
jgi:hypothetical protein